MLHVLLERHEYACDDGSPVCTALCLACLIVVARLGGLAKPAFSSVVGGFHFWNKNEGEQVVDTPDEALLKIDELPLLFRRVFGDFLFVEHTERDDLFLKTLCRRFSLLFRKRVILLRLPCIGEDSIETVEEATILLVVEIGEHEANSHS